MTESASWPAALSPEERGRLARRAATLSERLATPASGGSVHSLDAWRQAFSPTDPEALARRLAWDDLDEAGAAAALASEPVVDTAWTAWLPRVLDEARAWAEEVAAGRTQDELTALPEADEPPFVELWVPFLRAARRAASDASGGAFDRLPVAARRGLERPLLRELATVGELFALHGFHASGLPYSTFVLAMLRGRWRDGFCDFPVLARQLARLCETWAGNSADLLRRLDADRSEIALLLGFAPDLPESIAAGLSDRHHGGCRVAILGFASGRCLVYKPRDVGLERAFQDLLAWLAAQGLDPAPPALRILERPGYGWAEFVERTPLDSPAEADAFYARAGALLAVVHVFRGRDLHNENVIATAAGPVIIDSEAALVHMDRGEDEGSATGGAPGRAALRLQDSCLATSLVALVNADTLDQPFDIGGLRPSQGHMSSLPRRAWHGQRTDAIGFEPERRAERITSGAPLVGGRPVAPEEHADALLRGFASAYRFIMGRRETLLARLPAFAGRRTRILFRASDQYAALLMVLSAPRYQADGLVRGLALETLNRVFGRDAQRPRLWPLVAEERDDLERLDIPRFEVPVDATAVVARGGERVVGHFARSGVDAVALRLRRLGEDDLAAETALLAASLQPSPAPDTLSPGVSAKGRLVAAAEALGAAVRDAPPGLRRGPGEDRGDLVALYDGAAGRAVFFAALAASVGPAWRDEARAAAAAIEGALADRPGEWRGLGACTGIGSAVYSLVLVSRLIEEPALLESAVRFARGLARERIAGEGRADVESGLAGAVFGLLALHDATRDAAAFDLARACGERLMALQVDTGPGAAAWPSEDGRIHAGFAHGASGIALALGRLHAAAPDPRLAAAVAKALAHARLSYSPAERNWPLERRAGGTLPMVAWCHGAPGIALSRALLPGDLLDGPSRQELKVALETTAAAAPGRYDHLCCGRLGRADVLLTAGLRLGNASLKEAGQALIGPVAERVLAHGRLGARTAGFEWRVTLPGFFEGLAGIGYELLRFAAPERLPSVLGFETTQGGTEGC